MIGGLFRRPARRLLVAALVLAAIDPFVPTVVHRLEAARYESNRVFRFENSDLFALGPLAQYLREHPRGDRPRIVFFGNSVVWGYFLEPKDSIPGQFQRLTPGARVFNMAINGFESGNAYIITKQIIDAVDRIYVFPIGGGAHPMLPRLVEVERVDLQRFRLAPPDRGELGFARLLDFWRLHRDTYRLQAALFGTSTRLYVYSHKMVIPRMIWRVGRTGADEPRADAGARSTMPLVEVETDAARPAASEARRRDLAAAYPLLWDFAELVRRHAKHAVIVDIRGYSFNLSAADRADLNGIFAPHVKFVRLSIPDTARFDGVHLTAEGTAAVARALVRVTPPLTAGTSR
jgi:hypothetical protein